MVGNVWEWTASDFVPFPGFAPDPYEDYSQPWFNTRKVLRGEAMPAAHASGGHSTATSSRPSATTSPPDFAPARCDAGGALVSFPSKRFATKSTRRHDRGAGAFELGKFAARGHSHLERAAAAADHRTVGIRRIDGVQQPPPPRAAATAVRNIAAVPAGRGHAARVGERIGIADAGAALEQQVERRAAAGPIHARL